VSDVRDVVRAYRLLMEHGAPGEVYNVCTGVGVSVREIVLRLVARAHRPVRVETDPALLRPVEVPTLVGDSTKLHAATGWSPELTLDDTLDAVLSDARAR
jgi:GDP-4-dehydro-6-deoxy-D-mannose reductase